MTLRWLGPAAVCLVLAMTGIDGASLAYGQPEPTGRVDAPLRRLASQHPGAVLRVIVQARHAADAEQAVVRRAGTVKTPLPQLAGVAADVSGDQIEGLSREPGVVRVVLDPPMNAVAKPDASGPTSVYPSTVGATQQWSLGITGAGQSVAILDSGVQPHRDFGTPSRIVFNTTFNKGASSASDQYGHGTWVAGIAAGSGDYPGVAPRSSIVNLKVSDDAGAAYASDVLQALGWVIQHHADFNIRVVNLSFVSSVAEGYATSLLDAAVEMVWHAGVTVVVSAGNHGANSLLYAPANDPYVITVGAVDDAGTITRLDDTLAWFSSFGVTEDDFAKPDLVAPGRHIIGPLSSSGAQLALEFPSELIDPHYIRLSGTSGAAPVVSGGVALLGQARPDLKPDQVKWLLTHTASPIQRGLPGTGAGELDIGAAASFSGNVPRANLGLVPNRLVALAYLVATRQSQVNWDSVSWDSVSWDSVSWDSVSWDSVSWDSVSWDSVSWDSIVGDD